nr:hypothetical protein B0A51_08715 [Rachicladosporium sp. CCFEE 5018]
MLAILERARRLVGHLGSSALSVRGALEVILAAQPWEMDWPRRTAGWLYTRRTAAGTMTYLASSALGDMLANAHRRQSDQEAQLGSATQFLDLDHWAARMSRASDPRVDLYVSSNTLPGTSRPWYKRSAYPLLHTSPLTAKRFETFHHYSPHNNIRHPSQPQIIHLDQRHTSYIMQITVAITLVLSAMVSTIWSYQPCADGEVGTGISYSCGAGGTLTYGCSAKLGAIFNPTCTVIDSNVAKTHIGDTCGVPYQHGSTVSCGPTGGTMNVIYNGREYGNCYTPALGEGSCSYTSGISSIYQLVQTCCKPL